MLGMYDMPALQAANDRFWSLIRDHLGHGPDGLTRDTDHWEVWENPNMVFAQTCGFPYRTRLHGKVQLVGTPDYGLKGCPPGHYRSVFLTHKDDPRDLDQLAAGTFAYNEALSQSGWAGPMVHLVRHSQIPEVVLATGGHAQSAQAVADGRADYTALDALTWALLQENSAQTWPLRELGATTPTPTLPYITANRWNARSVARAVRAAMDDLTPEDRTTLHLRGLIDIPARDYLSVPNPVQAAADMPNT